MAEDIPVILLDARSHGSLTKSVVEGHMFNVTWVAGWQKRPNSRKRFRLAREEVFNAPGIEKPEGDGLDLIRLDRVEDERCFPIQSAERGRTGRGCEQKAASLRENLFQRDVVFMHRFASADAGEKHSRHGVGAAWRRDAR